MMGFPSHLFWRKEIYIDLWLIDFLYYSEMPLILFKLHQEYHVSSRKTLSENIINEGKERVEEMA